MVTRSHGDDGRVSRWFSARIQSLSARISQKLRSKEGFLTSIFLALSVLLGSWAHSRSQKEAIAKWEKTHFPALQRVDTLLFAAGFRTLEEGLLREKLTQSILNSIDEHEAEGWFWATPNGQWVGYLSSDAPIRIYCRNCNDQLKNPKKGQRLEIAKMAYVGLGWDGLEVLLQKIDSIPVEIAVPSAREQRNTVRVDPREIVY